MSTQITAVAKFKSFQSVVSDICNKLPGHLSSISALLALREEADIQLSLNRFPDSCVSSLIRTGWCGRASCHQNSLQYPWRFFYLVVKLNLKKCCQRFGCLPWRNVWSWLSVEENEVFKIKDDDDEEDTEYHLSSSAFPHISSPSTDITLCDITHSLLELRSDIPCHHNSSRLHTGACVNSSVTWKLSQNSQECLQNSNEKQQAEYWTLMHPFS